MGQDWRTGWASWAKDCALRRRKPQWRATCSGRACTSRTWCRKVPTTASPTSRTTQGSCCCARSHAVSSAKSSMRITMRPSCHSELTAQKAAAKMRLPKTLTLTTTAAKFPLVMRHLKTNIRMGHCYTMNILCTM